MGQKINPVGFRLGVNQNWRTAWYADKNSYAANIEADMHLRKFLQSRLVKAGLESLLIKRFNNRVEVNVSVARPGVVIGRGGAGIESIKKDLSRTFRDNIELKVFEVKRPEISAQLIADNIANQLSRRLIPKVACQRAIEAAKATNLVKGVRIWVSGRIKGAEIARTEKFQWGMVPLQTLRADIDYAYLTAAVPNAGKHGIKVWVYKGEKFTYDNIE